MKKRFLSLSILSSLLIPTLAFAQDTVVVHTVKLTTVGTVLKVDDKVVTLDVYRKYEDEQKNFMQKCTGDKPCWINFMRGNKVAEEGIFTMKTVKLSIKKSIRYPLKASRVRNPITQARRQRRKFLIRTD
jgi:hypothetical protein